MVGVGDDDATVPMSRESAVRLDADGLAARGSWTAWFLFIGWQFGACERTGTGLPLHRDVDGVPAAAVLAHAVQGLAIVRERDPLARRASQGDRATVCDD